MNRRARENCPAAPLVKAVIDRIVSAVLLVLAAPLCLLIAVAIKSSSRGPVLFRQVRCGHKGSEFVTLKFRTMLNDAEARLEPLLARSDVAPPVFKIMNDPRVTRVGYVLRRTSLDELPQLLNVLHGEMSLVGPRPPLPKEVTQYGSRELKRLSVKPGMTCLWQVSGRSLLPFEIWIELDLQYIENWSLWLDLKIALKTIPAVLSMKGAC